MHKSNDSVGLLRLTLMNIMRIRGSIIMIGISYDSYHWCTLVRLSGLCCELEEWIKLEFKFGTISSLRFNFQVFLCEKRFSQRSGGHEICQPVPHFLSGEEELGDIGRIFNEHIGTSHNRSCYTHQQAPVYHLWKYIHQKCQWAL